MYESVHDKNIDEIRQLLLDDLYFFFYFAFSRVMNKKPEIPEPPGRFNHIRIMADGLMAAFRGEKLVLSIGVPPRCTKTTMACMGAAWCYAHRADANFIYATYNKTLATEQTEFIRSIIKSRFFQTYFDTRLSDSSSAKDNFKTTKGGRTLAVGFDGSGLGRGAGTTDDKPYGGAIIIDDPLKTEEAHSHAARSRVVRVYARTLINRRNSPARTPIINIAQRTDQQDLTGSLLEGVDEKPIDVYQDQWRDNAIIIPGLDAAGNSIWPSKYSKEYLENLREVDEYTFYSQMQQQPISPSNRIFKVEHLKLLKKEPEILVTFITADTAETADKVNDATAFSMWGLYDIILGGQKTGLLGLHSINCKELRVEPEELEECFEEFYITCLRHPVKPSNVYIEKKSTGTYLLSLMRNKPGLGVIDIQRTAKSGNKTYRFRKAAPYLAKGQVSIMHNAYHLDTFREHLNLITFDESQRHDDIADTFADAVRLGLDEQVVYNTVNLNAKSQAAEHISAINRARRAQTARYTT